MHILDKMVTLNPVMGCNIGCRYCYARKINNRFKHIPDFNVPTFFPERLNKMKDNTCYFITSMSDFSSWKPEWCDTIFHAIANHSSSSFTILTKMPALCDFQCDLDNVAIGVTVTNADDVHRIQELREHIKVPHWHITFEPLHGDVGKLDLTDIEWIVIGMETGNDRGKKRTEASWVDNIVKQADVRKIPIFMKDGLGLATGYTDLRKDAPYYLQKFL